MVFSKNKDLLGLDIGSSSIKLVELSAGKNGYQLKHFRIMPLPPEAIVDGSIMDAGAVVDAIRELISLEEVKTKNVAVSISGHSVIVKKIKLPLMTEDELEESIQWEAEQYIPFDITDVNLDVEILGSNEDAQEVGEMEVLLVAAKKDMINDHTAVLEEAGLKPQIVDIDAFCIENMFEENYSSFNDGVVVLANIGSNITNVNVLEKGMSAFTRDISIGGSQFTEEIQKQLNVSYDEAEALKIGGDLGAPTETTEAVIPQEVGSIIRSVSEGIAAEIQRSLDFYSATSNEDKINKIYLMGGSARVPGLPAVIEGEIGVPVEIANPFNNIEIDERDFNIAHISEVAPAAAVAVGLALRKIGDS